MALITTSLLNPFALRTSFVLKPKFGLAPGYLRQLERGPFILANLFEERQRSLGQIVILADADNLTTAIQHDDGGVLTRIMDAHSFMGSTIPVREDEDVVFRVQASGKMFGGSSVHLLQFPFGDRAEPLWQLAQIDNASGNSGRGQGVGVAHGYVDFGHDKSGVLVVEGNNSGNADVGE